MDKFVIVGALLLAGCHSASAADKLTDQYNIMERAGASKDDLCAQGRKIQQAYLEAGDEENYKSRKLYSDIECMRADQERRLGA